MAPVRHILWALGGLGLLSPVQALYSSTSDVVQLDLDTFKEKVVRGDGLWLVEFYAPWCGHCKSLVPEWEKAASHLKGVVNVAAVDATQHEKLAQKFQIQGFPTIKVFGADKRNPTDYQGQRTADAIVKEGMQQANKLVKARVAGKASRPPSSASQQKGAPTPKAAPQAPGGRAGKGDVVELTSANFEEQVMNSDEQWLVEFFAPWCGHCKKLEPEWAAAASDLKGQVNLGAVDATVHADLAQRYGVQGYPTIKVFPAGKKGAPKDYNGPREQAGIVQAALQLLEESGYVPEIKELVSQAVLDEKCSGKKICVIAALPHILDSGKAGREAYHDTLQGARKQVTGSSYFNFLWAEGGSQPDLEQALGLTFGYPAVFAYSKEKQAYAIHIGSFSDAGIAKFLNGLMTGATKTLSAPSLPKIQTVQAWDGKEPERVQEDDLADIMGVEL